MMFLTKSEIKDLITLSKDLCVYSEELEKYIKEAYSYSQAQRHVMSVFDGTYMKKAA